MRLLTALAALFLTLASFAQERPLNTASIDKLMLNTLRAWQIPGAAIGIVRNDRVVYLQGYGTKELGGTDPITADTLFQIASTTKAFTSTALAMLATDQKLSFDDPVRKHVPYFHLSDLCADANVTLRDIVTHRTGLSRHDELWDDTPLTREELVRSMGQVALTKPFRTAYQYQNITFVTAGEAVANASGMSWDDFVRTRIFRPLKMNGTVLTDAEWMASNHAGSYRYDWKTGRFSPRRLIETDTIGAAGGIKSNARDMANWLRFQLAGGAFEGTQLVDPNHLAETKAPHTVIRVEGTTRELNPETHLLAYAMGWNVLDYRGELLVTHGGALNGFRTHVTMMPRRNTGFVIMINAERGYSLYAMRNALSDMLSGKPSRDWNSYYLMVDQRTEEKAEKEKEERLARRVPNTTPTRPLADYAGEYTHPGYGTARVTLTNGELVLQWNRITSPLVHFHHDVFNALSEFHDLDEPVAFFHDDEKKVKGLTFFGERFERRAP